MGLWKLSSGDENYNPLTVPQENVQDLAGRANPTPPEQLTAGQDLSAEMHQRIEVLNLMETLVADRRSPGGMRNQKVIHAESQDSHYY